jgi:hypothetical protein
MFPANHQIQVQTIFDDDHGHYLLLMVGWENNTREYAPIIHIDIDEQAKVFLQHDGTDLKIALLLAENGIPKSSIVIAYRSPLQRTFFPEFAAA